IPMTLLVAPGLAHQFPPEWQQNAEAEYLKFAAPDKGRNPVPERVRFTTYTLKYPSCDWVEILGLDQHYQRSEGDATRTEKGFTVKTASVRALRLAIPGGDGGPLVVSIDGQDLPAKPHVGNGGVLNVYLERRDGRWSSALPQKIVTERQRRPQKVSGLQGPID